MPRISRGVAAGLPHHIPQRGNYRQSVFETDVNRVLYLDWLKIYSAKYEIQIEDLGFLNDGLRRLSKSPQFLLVKSS